MTVMTPVPAPLEYVAPSRPEVVQSWERAFSSGLSPTASLDGLTVDEVDRRSRDTTCGEAHLSIRRYRCDRVYVTVMSVLIARRRDVVSRTGEAQWLT